MPPRYIAVPFTGGGTVLPIPTPSLNASVVSGSQINLTIAYSGPPGAVSYAFETSSAATGPWAPLASGTSPTFADTGLLASTIYFFRAKVQVTDGRFSDFSPVVSATTLASAPASPTGVVATDIDFDSITVSWNTVPQATSYNVYINGVLNTSGATSPQVINGLAASTTYNVQVSAQNSAGEGPLSATSQVTTAPLTAGSINWKPGHRFQVGNENHSNDTNAKLLAGNSDMQVQTNILFGLESVAGFARGTLIKGIMNIYQWDQLETGVATDPTNVRLAGLDNLVTPAINWCKANGIDFSMGVNGTGNAGNGSSTPKGAPSDTFTAFYGRVDAANGYYGSVFCTPSTNNAASIGPIINFSDPDTMSRYAQLGQAVYNKYGTDVYAYQPTWSEMSITQYDSTAQCNATFGPGGLFDQLRSFMPRTLLMASPTFLAFNTHSLGTIINDSAKRNHLSLGNFDSCCETAQPGSTSTGRTFTCDLAYRGLQLAADGSKIPLTDSSGNPYASMVGSKWDFFTHHSEDSLGGVGQLSGPPNPVARIGDGRLQVKKIHDVEQKTSHCWWAHNQRQGCNANRTVAVASGSGGVANYSDGSNTWSNLVGGIVVVYTNTMQQVSYPSTWPT